MNMKCRVCGCKIETYELKEDICDNCWTAEENRMDKIDEIIEYLIEHNITSISVTGDDNIVHLKYGRDLYNIAVSHGLEVENGTVGDSVIVDGVFYKTYHRR